MITDICANKHRGDRESREANRRVDKDTDRQVVYGIIWAACGYGRTLDEISCLLDRPVNTISGRITELKARGLIQWNGTRRPTRTGCSAKVYTVTERQGELEI